MHLSDKKWLNILLNILVIVVLPCAVGILMAMYIEAVIAAIVFVPGLIVSLGGALRNGSNVGGND